MEMIDKQIVQFIRLYVQICVNLRTNDFCIHKQYAIYIYCNDVITWSDFDLWLYKSWN